MIDDINKRIIELMEQTGHSKSTFAHKIGVSLPLITHITTGRNKPGLELIQKIISVFENINPQWLLLGKGEKFMEKQRMPDFTPLFNELQELSQQLLSVKKTQESVIQYHTLFLAELKHIEELDKQLFLGAKQINDVSARILRLKEYLKIN
jgi:DNA-binding XRE family transcriptional regulator